MGRRIMTVDELYSFCLKNNFLNFDSKEFGKELVVEMPANFEKSNDDTDKMTEGLTPFVSRAFHDHINLNKSEIKEQDFKDNLPSSHLRPILANIVKDEETGELDFGSHDYHIEEVTETDENGNKVIIEKTVYDEQPIGVIDGSMTSIEYDEEAKVNRAVLHGYLYNEYCQDAIDILNRRGTVDCSVELIIRELSFDSVSKTLVLNDFYVAGLTLLSAKCRPGMAGSNFKIEDFSADKNTFNFVENKLIEMQARLNKLEARFNINDQNNGQNENQEEGGNKNMDKFNELLSKYGKTIEDVDFDYEGLTDEELEQKFESVFGEAQSDNGNDDDNTDNVDDPEDNSSDDEPEIKEDNACGGGGSGSGSKKRKKNNSEEPAEDMVRTYTISHEDIRYALYQLLSEFESADNEWYCITGVYDDYFVYESWDGGKIYGQKYTKDNDNVAFDGERYTLHREYLTDSEYAELQSMRSNYSSIIEQLNAYKYAEDIADKLSIFEDEGYSAYLDTDEFKNLMSEDTLKKFTKEELIEKADAALGKAVKEAKTYSFNFSNEDVYGKKKNKIGVFSDFDTAKDQNPYGDYFKSIN